MVESEEVKRSRRQSNVVKYSAVQSSVVQLVIVKADCTPLTKVRVIKSLANAAQIRKTAFL